jgi:hypothetical protein
MNIQQLNSSLLKNQKIDSDEALQILVDFYEQTLIFLNKDLNNNNEDPWLISEDMIKISSYMTTVGMAKSIAEMLLENLLSLADEEWRKNQTADYKLSSKSSTNHQINLRGRNEIRLSSLISKNLTALYFDMNRKFDAIKMLASNLKFGIEKGLIDCQIKKTLKKD